MPYSSMAVEWLTAHPIAKKAAVHSLPSRPIGEIAAVHSVPSCPIGEEESHAEAMAKAGE